MRVPVCRLALATALLTLTACGGSSPEPAETPDAGETAQDAQPSAPDADTGADAAPQADAGVHADAEPADTGPDPDAGPISFPTLADFRVCDIDTDCPVGLGRCVKSLGYDRAAGAGASEVALSDLDSRIAPGQGVCSETCTLDPTACETMSLKNAAGEDVSFTCQVMALGISPYPSAPPAFPFGDQIDAAEMVLGQPFAALCRPPFELNEAHIANMCGACDDDGGCEGGTCWRFDRNAPVATGESGVCLEPAAQGCPIGFEVQALLDGAADLGEHCVPVQETCGPCLDRDGDGRGAGHCSMPVVDCDDHNAAAYYDEADMSHAFPTHCGNQDFNCNGLSDADEQVGVEAYLEFHCESCGDDLHGQTVNAGTSSEATLQCVAGRMQVATCADSDQVHCSGDVRQTGCEATAATGGQVFYRDADGDLFGDPNVTTLGCPGGGAPSGYVADNTDCNDSDTSINPSARDLCECWGDCAQLGTRVDNNCDGNFDEDVTGYLWALDGDSDGAGGAAFDSTLYCGAPAADTVISASGDDCADMDATSFGAHTRIANATGAALSLPISAAPPRDSSGNLYTVTVGPGVEVCDLADNDCSNGVDDGVQTTFYRDLDADTYGDPNQSTLACAAPSNYVADNTDCDDGDIDVHPGAAEICDDVDNDCVGGVDDTVPLGAACSTGLLGICDAGTQTACVNGQYTCTQTNPAEQFDDPDPLTPSDEDCDGPEAIIYVDPSGDNNNAGTQAAPRATLDSALSLANTNGATQIHMLSGNHLVDSTVFLQDGVDVVGGFSRSGNVWTWGGGTSTLQRDGVTTGTQVIAMSAVDATDLTLAYLTVQVVASATGTGITHMGLYALNSDGLRLENVTLDIAAGSDGADGIDGLDGFDGVDGVGSVAPRMLCGSTDVSGGMGGRPGFPPGDGSGEGAGAGAESGDPLTGAAASPLSVDAAGGEADRPLWSYSQTNAAAEAGAHGAGGAGGIATAPPSLGGGGGSGGCGGEPGTNGEVGGSSIGIFSAGSEGITMVGVTITVGGGGDGGAGGDGGHGGDRGDGAAGTGFSGDGGDGRGGRGGGGGGSGYGGHAYPIYHRGTVDLCSASGTSNVIRNITGTAGAGGTAGRGGRHGDSTARSDSGEAGHDGYSVNCFWSQPCITTSCGTGETCSQYYCVPDPT